MGKKPVLTLPKKTATAVQPEASYGEKLRAIIVEEWQRTDYSKAATLEAVMARIVGDREFFEQLAVTFIQQRCRKRIKKLGRARALALAVASACEPD